MLDTPSLTENTVSWQSKGRGAAVTVESVHPGKGTCPTYSGGLCDREVPSNSGCSIRGCLSRAHCLRTLGEVICSCCKSLTLWRSACLSRSGVLISISPGSGFLCTIGAGGVRD